MQIKMYGIAKAESGKGFDEYLDVREGGKRISYAKTGVTYRTMAAAREAIESKNIEENREAMKSWGFTHANTLEGERIEL